MTSSVTWPSDSAWALSCWWSMMTMRLCCTAMEIQGFEDFRVTSLTFWGHVTSSVTWPLDSVYVVSYWWSVVTMHLSCTVMEIWSPKDIEVTTLTFWGHVTSSVTWPLNLAYVVSYWWSIGTMRLSCTVTDYKASKLHLPMLKAKSSVRMRRVTWPVGRGSKITTYLEFPSPHCLFTIQLLWGYDDD